MSGLRALAERASGLPLRWQIGTLVVLGLIGIFALFGVLGSAIAGDAKQRTVEEWLSVATSTASSIDSDIELRFGLLEHAATLVGQAVGDPARQRQVLDDAFGQQDSRVGEVLLLDRNGAITWATPPEPNPVADDVSAQASFLTPLTTGTRYASGVHTLEHRVATFLAVPVYGKDRQVIGVLGLVMRPDQGPIYDLVASARGLAHTGHAELIDQDDRVVASSEAGHALGPGEHPDFYEPLLAARRSAVGLTAAVGSVDPADQGQRHEMAFVPLRSVPWALALGGSDAELSADANRWQQQIILFGALSLGLALVLVWLTTRSVARPILALAAASRQIAAGDLTTPVPREGEGEVRVLAQAFDDMRLGLQGALSDLALEKSRHEGIVASMADALVTTDTDLRITAFNPSSSTLTGWSVEEVLGRSWCDVICPKHASPEGRQGECPLPSSQPDLGVSKAILRRRDGSQVSVAITRSAIRDQTGRLAGLVHVLRDISAEAEVDRLKEEFLSTVSHELRTPLGFIMGYATTLLLPDAPKDRGAMRRCIEVIVDASNELKELVDNLLDMTKIGAGSLSVSPEPIQLGPLVHAAVERIRGRGSDHRFVTVVPSSLPIIWADAHRVEQVLYNLLDNAIKYSPEGGDIAVGATAVGQEVVVSVLDEGLGIMAGELDGVFERFHRGQIARTRGIAGTGIGLAICKGIVEAHGGRIWAESPPVERRLSRQRGTAIRFTVPVATAQMLGVSN
jgi:two-component system phosphate regulon sensor histidine kinase PhoR